MPQTETPRLIPARRTVLVWAGLFVALAAAAVLRLMIGEEVGWPGGSVFRALGQVFFGQWQTTARPPAADTLLTIRLLRLVLGLVVGTALASSGVALQALLRNPLAEPYILGLSSGAAVGVMLQMILSQFVAGWIGASHLGALAGALAAMGVVYVAGRRRGVIDPLGLLLVGVVLSTINGALIMVLHFVYAPPGVYNDLARWMMGFLNETVGPANVLSITVLTMACVALLVRLGPAMDAAGFSDAEALSLGVSLARLRKLLFVIAGALAAGAVVLAGPIAFVGLICPHVARLLLGPGHRTLLLGAALAGAALIVLADTAATLLDFGQGRMPLGIFTAMIGGPAFLWMLRPHLGRGVD